LQGFFSHKNNAAHFDNSFLKKNDADNHDYDDEKLDEYEAI